MWHGRGFGEVKKVVKTQIIPLFDHRLILRKDSRFQHIAPINERIRLVDYQPTCENMLIEIVGILQNINHQALRWLRLFYEKQPIVMRSGWQKIINIHYAREKRKGSPLVYIFTQRILSAFEDIDGGKFERKKWQHKVKEEER